ncbi:ABC transporter ATP-binding protein [Methylocapsa sp. S129]|uniref:ABC transporter ATP-binding protein n=1 Tax=Methylocapsa sp. S129 TaxID=1641869 RepID=UPI00131E5928|nr:ABC transporter ATP-binding protein [Methylocapsa sp. S129]
MTELLTVRKLDVRHGKTIAVEQVDLSLAQGSVLALLGANGAGKSSILKAIAGLVDGQGEIIFEARDISRLSARERVRLGIVYVPEGREIVTDLTVDENLTLGGFFLDSRTLGSRRAKMLELFPEIAKHIRAPAWMLSGGEQQMLAIGRALMSAPRLLLLDEPSLGLAPLLIRRVFERLMRIRAESDLSILLVEQSFRMTLRVSDTVCFVRNGQIVGVRKASDLDASSSLAEVLEAYLGAAQPIAMAG